MHPAGPTDTTPTLSGPTLSGPTVSDPTVSDPVEPDPIESGPTEWLEAEVCTLAGRIAAATCRFVQLAAELDRRGAWREWGCRSMAHWLSWKCALGLVAAREHVRVGHALRDLPLLTDAFAHGRLSYSKVRALTRVATPGSEADLLEFATVATAAQLDRTVRAYERVSGDAAAEAARLDARGLHFATEADGTVSIRGRLTPDQAAMLRRALDGAGREVPRDDADDPTEAMRRADALELLAVAFLAGRSDRPPTEVVVHVDAAQLAEPDLPPALARVLCDTRIRTVVTGAAGGEDGMDTAGAAGGAAAARAVTRRSRTIPVALRRVIERRDGGCCRFPGCPNTRFLHVHHIAHFAYGGATDTANCVSLCTFHHRAVHEGGWRLFGDGDGRIVVVHPRGRRIVEVEEPGVPGASGARETQGARLASGAHRSPSRSPEVDAHTIATATGERLDLALAVDVVIQMCRPDRN